MSQSRSISTLCRFAGYLLLCAAAFGVSATENDPPLPDEEEAEETCERGLSLPGQCDAGTVAWAYAKSLCPPSSPHSDPFYDCLPPSVAPSVFVQCAFHSGYGYCSATPKALGTEALTFEWSTASPLTVYEYAEDPSWADFECVRNRGSGTVTVTVKDGSTILGTASFSVSCRLTI